MIIIIYNNSRKKSFRQTKRIITQVLPDINNRMNFGDVPKRVALQLIVNLKKVANRGTNIKIFIATKEGYRGFKGIEIGKKNNFMEKFNYCKSHIDDDLLNLKLIEKF